MTKLIVVGGFLGAGKTTSIISLAKELLSKGKKIGIVTNDQGSNLVDTSYMASQGLPVLEVGGGCFCCNLDEFARKLSIMQEREYPDYIIAEPVGSCINLVATLMKPIKKGYTNQFSLAPLSVVTDPKRLKRVIRDQSSPFPNEINYLFSKQLEEADMIIINKMDSISDTELADMENFLKSKYHCEIKCISARNNVNIDSWCEALLSGNENFDAHSLDVEYDMYKKAESMLGWLNSSMSLKSDSKIDANAFLQNLCDDIKLQIQNSDFEIAHLKAYLVSNSDFCKLSCVSVYEKCEFDSKMSIEIDEAALILNIRAAVPAAILKNFTEISISKICQLTGAVVSDISMEAFSPTYAKPKAADETCCSPAVEEKKCCCK